MNQQVMQLLERVGARQRLASLGHWFYVMVMWLAGVYALVLVVARVSSLIPDWYSPPTLLVIFIGALGIAVALGRKPSLAETARAVDERTGAKDVFLTAALIENAPGDYKPLVLAEAAGRAGSVRPEAVAPFNFWPKAGQIGLVTLALLLAIFVFPHFDPFGREKERAKEAEKRQRLDESIKEVSQRTAAMQDKPLDAEQSQEVEQALTDLKLTFSQMKPHDPVGNLQQLSRQQQQVGEMWRKSAEERLKESLDQSPMDEKFGAADNPKTKQWEEELKQGKTDSMQQEAQAIQDMAEKMKTESDPGKRSQMQQEMSKRVQDLSDFVNSHAGKDSLKDALAKAQQQMSAGNSPGLSSKAMSAAAQSMSLTKSELKSLAQSMRDFKSLQSALDAIEAAKQANSAGKLDGQGMQPGMSMKDYEKYFNSLGRAPGMGPPKWTPGGNNKGQAWGRRPAADPDAKVDFKPEKDNSVLTAGKTLLDWKEKGMSESGTARKDYVQSVKTLKEGVSEAILKEEIPPGYHDQIQKYFDDMEKVTAKQGGGSKVPTPPPGAP